ncbi:BZ3500_MvSof-1268-A1-R1_Chr8-1g09919 [Microbotryum saponariae]|uniref:BZ3500_MvSof-1268-A1-R1_Chr8-1g09919 protein n=1 Tax=Microbotryum saponariae TaxID=289078 RepID=A0A2X0LIQ3_9BASI|nr:BZ3500_MvSof-1268-A1-R1_Chr8-1g09919 [Microbotryum saponariae]SDA08205.1 BZ3501_MvSof-1269-A2-R1_Chr8-1g09642 [Microbotryum saponariae]
MSSLAPPPVAPAATVPPPPRATQPASSRPAKTDAFNLKYLLRLPIRIFSPPKASGMIGSVRSLRATPLNDVRLADVIENKHFSPLSLKDFEGYLVFREHAAENLYFILSLTLMPAQGLEAASLSPAQYPGLNEYEKEWNAWQRDPTALKEAHDARITDPHASRTLTQFPPQLRESLERGLDAFFTPDGALELNLSDATRDKVLVEARSGNPADFEEARGLILHSLHRSLAAHSKACVANAGPRRLVFCFCLGLSIFLLGLIPPLVGILGGYARAWRVVGLPFIWFGTAVMVMAVNRICGVIWLLGEDRQLLRYEAEPPTVLSNSIVDLGPATPRSSSSSWDEESAYGDEKDCSPEPSFTTRTSATPYPWERTDASAGVDSATSCPPSYLSKASTLNLVPSSAQVWGPVTKVFSPDVVRAQWRLAVGALLAGVVGLLTVGVVLMAVPNRA